MTKDKQGTVEDRVITFRMSDETVDRDRDIIKASGWKTDNFKKNPVFLRMHKKEKFPIGRFDRIWTADNALMGQVRFANKGTSPDADLAYELYKQGIMNAVSVSYTSDDFEENEHGGYTYNSQELIECSAVPVPANPNALAIAKGYDKETRRHFIKEVVQSDGAEEDSYEATADETTAEPYEDITDECLERVTKILQGAKA